MKYNVKNLIIIAITTGIGALTGYYYAKSKYEQILAEEIVSMRERFEEYTDVEAPKIGDESEDEYTPDGEVKKYLNGVKIEDGTGEEAATRAHNDPQGMPFKAPYEPVEQRIRPRDRYSKVVKKYQGNNEPFDPAETERPSEDPADIYDKYERMTEEANQVYNRDLPYIISTEEFNEGCKHFDKLTISYYELDDTLADEGEEIVDDPVALIGEDTLERFGEDSGDPEIVYVRNERLQIDYEIILTHKSYQETVIGTPPKGVGPRPKKGKKSSRADR